MSTGNLIIPELFLSLLIFFLMTFKRVKPKKWLAVPAVPHLQLHPQACDKHSYCREPCERHIEDVKIADQGGEYSSCRDFLREVPQRDRLVLYHGRHLRGCNFLISSIQPFWKRMCQNLML